MNGDLVKRLLEEYREMEKCLIMGIDILKDSDYAKGKLDVVKVIISDLEGLLLINN
ncbi:MAG: hypothetical protein IJO26_01115 [Clostridium sp.]|nr:hypothetical protein [Clostridium sp.]